MPTLKTQSIEAIVISIIPVDEYRGEVHSQAVKLQIGDQIWSVLDAQRLTAANLVREKCLVNLVAFLGIVKENNKGIKASEILSDFRMSFWGEIIELSVTPNQETHPPSRDVELLLDVGHHVVIRCYTIYWELKTDRHEIGIQDIRKGNFVSIAQARMDLTGIEIMRL